MAKVEISINVKEHGGERLPFGSSRTRWRRLRREQSGRSMSCMWSHEDASRCCMDCTRRDVDYAEPALKEKLEKAVIAGGQRIIDWPVLQASSTEK